MPDTGSVSEHYTRGDLLEAIREGVRKLGKSEATVTLEDLGPVEEFHIGGRQASADFLDQLSLRAEHIVLDVGCGLGGTARFAASRSGCRVFGVDLTDEYVTVGKVMTQWVGLDGRVSHQQGNATDLPFADACFDSAYMMHVGMNIADKPSLMQELARVLKLRGRRSTFSRVLKKYFLYFFSDRGLSPAHAESSTYVLGSRPVRPWPGYQAAFSAAC